jgi:acetylornithine deacetylase/succinyl-diaminopimelate desuccinylase-like protein
MRALAHWKIAVPAAVSVFTAVGASNAQVTTPGADEAAFRALYKELIEINTTRSVGNCTQAVEAMRKRLLAAGYAAEDMQILAPPEAPNDGALIAVLHGRRKAPSRSSARAHDVVEARREDWTRDPFKLDQEAGLRGASDDKAIPPCSRTA